MGTKDNLIKAFVRLQTDGMDPKRDRDAIENLKVYARKQVAAISTYVTSLQTNVIPLSIVDAVQVAAGTSNTAPVALTDASGNAAAMEQDFQKIVKGPDPSATKKYAKDMRDAVEEYGLSCGLAVGTFIETSTPGMVPVPYPGNLVIDTVTEATAKEKLVSDFAKLEGDSPDYGKDLAGVLSDFIKSLSVVGPIGFISVKTPVGVDLGLATLALPIAITEIGWYMTSTFVKDDNILKEMLKSRIELLESKKALVKIQAELKVSNSIRALSAAISNQDGDPTAMLAFVDKLEKKVNDSLKKVWWQTATTQLLPP